ncbi:DUF6088 family protein [Dyadobacter sp. CY261]|nr:DUF6088 family protein [Dyadobacter sp. CY261]
MNVADVKIVSKALERLVLSRELYRVANGTYERPVNDRFLGVLLPGIEEIAERWSRLKSLVQEMFQQSVKLAG